MMSITMNMRLICNKQSVPSIDLLLMQGHGVRVHTSLVFCIQGGAVKIIFLFV